MCDQLSEIRQAISRYAASLEPELLEVADASRVVKEAAAIEATASALVSLAAARVADSGNWKRSGHRSAAEALARETGTSVTSAREALDVGRRLASQPDVDHAARQGKLSAAQLSMVTNAAEADPASQRRLVNEAQGSSLAVLREACARTKAAALPDPEQRRRSIHQARSLRAWTDIEGVWRLSASGNPEDGAQIMSALAPISDEIFRSARSDGRREQPAAYAFDALVQLARDSTCVQPSTPKSALVFSESSCGPGPSTAADRTPAVAGSTWSLADSRDPHGSSGHVGPGRGSQRSPSPRSPSARSSTGETSVARRRSGAPAKLLLRVDYDTFLRGAPREGETCELVGYGPIAMSAVRDVLDSGNPFVAAILTRAKAVVGVAHLGRQPTSHQQSALEWIYPSCAVQGCHSQAHLQRDHRVDWAKTHYTMLDLLDLLCAHHHDLKTRQGWELVEGSGKRPFVAPDDERHPRHRRSGSLRAPRSRDSAAARAASNGSGSPSTSEKAPTDTRRSRRSNPPTGPPNAAA